MALAERLARWSEDPDGLTCTYLTSAHRSVAAELRDLMLAAGLSTEIDAVGNVVGRYAADDPKAPALIVASHYDTVRNAGKYDGRLGILIALVVAEHLLAAAPQAAVSPRRHCILGGGGSALLLELSRQQCGRRTVRLQAARAARCGWP